MKETGFFGCEAPPPVRRLPKAEGIAIDKSGLSGYRKVLALGHGFDCEPVPDVQGELILQNFPLGRFVELEDFSSTIERVKPESQLGYALIESRPKGKNGTPLEPDAIRKSECTPSGAADPNPTPACPDHPDP
jgi:hypothetical protein